MSNPKMNEKEGASTASEAPKTQITQQVFIDFYLKKFFFKVLSYVLIVFTTGSSKNKFSVALIEYNHFFLESNEFFLCRPYSAML